MTLHLTLKKEWFHMIASGEKTEEYREIKPYWWNRLVQCGEWDERRVILSKKYDTIIFRNGYSKNSPTITIECLGIKTGVGLYILGAPNYPVFIIKLGKIISTKNI